MQVLVYSPGRRYGMGIRPLCLIWPQLWVTVKILTDKAVAIEHHGNHRFFRGQSFSGLALVWIQ